MQINPDLLDASYNIPLSLFQSDLYIIKMDNNQNELISRRQQDRVLLVVRGDLCAIAKLLEGDPTGLGRWNSIDIYSDQCKIRFITTYCCVKSRQTNNTVFMQQLRYFQRKKRNICPVKAFTIDLSYFLQQSLQQGFELIVCLDINKNMKVDHLARVFRSLDLLETMQMFYQGVE